MSGLLRETSQGDIEGGPEGTEGIDKLTEFFQQNSTLKSEWYDILVQKGVEYEHLMEWTDTILQGTLKIVFDQSYGQRIIAMAQIHSAVTKCPESTIYKERNTTKVSVVSTEEYAAAQKLHEESERISKGINRITNITTQLTANSQNCEKMIIDTFNLIIDSANQRKELLLAQLKEIKTAKYNKLMDQENAFKAEKQTLEEEYNKIQEMFKDTSIDVVKRKTKILTRTQELLSNNTDLRPITTDKINVYLDVIKLNQQISKIGMVSELNRALPPSVRIAGIKSNEAKVVLIPNQEEKSCEGHKVEYTKYIAKENNDEKKDDDDQLNWKSINVSANGHQSVQCMLKSLDKATKYMVRAATKNKNGFGVYSRPVSFTTKSFNPRKFYEGQMVFSPYGINRKKIKIINDQQVECLQNNVSIRLNCAMPIQIRENNKHSIKLIRWTLNPSLIQYGNANNFIGVVSNRTNGFGDSAFHGIVDSYGISGAPNHGPMKGWKCTLDKSMQQWKRGMVTVEYKIQESRLSFYQLGYEIYTMILPVNIKEITHWYPAISLANAGAKCKITEVEVELRETKR